MPVSGFDSTTCIVVPCFNEEQRLDASTFLRFVESDPGVHFLFVNDGSRDGTSELLARLSHERPGQLRKIDLDRNSGKAEAIRLGTNSLADWKSFDYVGFLDADLSAPLTTIAELQQAIAPESRFEFAMGSRVALMGRAIHRNAVRHYIGRGFATAVSLMLGLPVYDTQCGAKLFRAALIPEIFAQPFVTRWFFDVEVIFRILGSRGRQKGSAIIVEVPLLSWTEKGSSKLAVSDFLTTPVELFRIWRHYRDTR